MTTGTTHIAKYSPYYNLLAAIIDPAVEEFNHGTIPQKQAAAAFFRDEYNDWIWRAGNATVQDVIRNRLNADPFNINFKSSAVPKKRKKARLIKYDGQEMTVREWSAKTGLTIATIHSRLIKYGSCAKTFTPGRIKRADEIRKILKEAKR